jgi:hypothetical protein
VKPPVTLGALFLACAVSVGWAAVASAKPAGTPQLREVFRFGAGSGLFARPGVGQQGDLYVGSGDGYVHAIRPDGSYRWSYTVKGRVIAPPVEEPATQRAFVVTSEARLYALEPDSRLRWVFPLPVAPKSEMALTPKGTLLFVGQDDHLYGVTTSGALVLRLASPGARSGPVVLGDGKTALVLNDQLAILKGYGFERTPLSGPQSAASWLELSADRAVFACESGKARVFGSAGALLDASSDCLAPPVRGDGFFAVAESRGDVRLFYAAGGSATVSLGSSPLRPLWDGPRRRLILSSATGVISVLEVLPEPAP